MIRIIAKQDVEKLITMEEVIVLLEQVFADYTLGKTIVPLRTKIEIKKHKGNILYMPALIPESDALGVKIVSVYPENAAKNKHTIYSTIMLNDAETGEPIALMDAEHITALRTGAISGLAAKYLSSEQAKIVCVFGSGVQARTQLEAVCSVRKIEKAYIFSIDSEGRKRFSEEMSKKLKIQVLEGENQSLILPEADIIITATTSQKPVFDGELVKAGAFVTGVGSYTPTMQEVPESLVKKAAIVVDAYDAALKEAGDLLIPMENGTLKREDIRGELGEVILGKVGRQNADEIIFFKTVGLAVQDMIVAPKVYKNAIEKGMGVEVGIY